MDIRIMEYYLAIIREGNISAAAEALHVSQSALSRQIKDLEEELGVKLFERGSRRIKLTEEGMILRRRAEEMVRLMQITGSEISRVRSSLTGEVHIGAGESLAFHHLSRIAGEIHREYPDIRFTITSGDTADLMDQLDNGLIDVALVFTDYDHSQYQGIRLPDDDRLGLLMRKDSPLAGKAAVTVSDLKGLPLIVPRAARELLSSDPGLAELNIVTVYNLIYNASLFVEDGVGCAIGFGGLVNVSGDSPLTFRPLESPLSQSGTVIWKKYEIFSPAVNLFLERLREM
jgi:DNA-binding transcriptional LysR family regulator